MRSSGRSSPATRTSVLAGRHSASRNSSRTARMVTTSETSTTKNVSLTTSDQLAPAAARARRRCEELRVGHSHDPAALRRREAGRPSWWPRRVGRLLRRPTQQRAGAPSGGPGQLLCQRSSRFASSGRSLLGEPGAHELAEPATGAFRVDAAARPTLSSASPRSRRTSPGVSALEGPPSRVSSVSRAARASAWARSAGGPCRPPSPSRSRSAPSGRTSPPPARRGRGSSHPASAGHT